MCLNKDEHWCEHALKHCLFSCFSISCFGWHFDCAAKTVSDAEQHALQVMVKLLCRSRISEIVVSCVAT